MVASSKSSIALRAALGDFSTCSTVSKWAARIGQCLTTTIDYRIHGSVSKDIIIVPDIKSKLDMEHSDGTGIITRRLFNVVCAQVPFAPNDPNDISILQVRIGGAKGTLSAWNADEQLVQREIARRGTHEIILRESMTKFEANYDSIEVCAVGTTVVS
jgi:RNA-dependent RNA polymerase